MATASKKAGAVKAAPVKSKKSESAGTALSAKNITRLSALGIEATTEEEARPKLLEIFKRNNLDDMGDDPITDLIEMAEAFPETAGEEAEAEEVEEVEEVTKKGDPKKGKKAKEEVEEEPEEEELEEVVEEELEEEEIEAELEEEEEAPVPKAKKSAKKKSSVKEAEEEADALVEEVEEKDLKVPKARKIAPPASDGKKAKKKTTRVRKLLGKHWEDLTLAEKEKAVKPLRKALPEKEYRFDFLQRSFVVKYLGKTSEHNIFKYHLLRLLENGKLEGVLISHRFKTAEELQAYLPEELGGALLKTGMSCSYIQPFNQDSLTELLGETDFLKDSIAIATKQDNKMKANREKLEEQLNGKKESKKTVAKATPAAKGKKVEPEAENEPEEEEEEVAPKKTVAKKVVAKAVPVKKEAPKTAVKTPAKKEVATAKKVVAKKK